MHHVIQKAINHPVISLGTAVLWASWNSWPCNAYAGTIEGGAKQDLPIPKGWPRQTVVANKPDAQPIQEAAGFSGRQKSGWQGQASKKSGLRWPLPAW